MYLQLPGYSTELSADTDDINIKCFEISYNFNKVQKISCCNIKNFKDIWTCRNWTARAFSAVFWGVSERMAGKHFPSQSEIPRSVLRGDSIVQGFRFPLYTPKAIRFFWLDY